MRPEKAHAEIRKAIYRSMKDGKTIHIKRVKKEINKLHSAQKKDWIDCLNSQGIEVDLYVYDTEEKGVKPGINWLECISDRFVSYHNLEWLRGVADDDFDDFEGWCND